MSMRRKQDRGTVGTIPGAMAATQPRAMKQAGASGVYFHNATVRLFAHPGGRCSKKQKNATRRIARIQGWIQRPTTSLLDSL
jgi:hypothetical protein